MLLKKDDRILVRSAGGGGYGDPAERTVERIVEDLADGYVSLSAAKADYGYQSG
jgi:N-methylhydantoinase B